MAGEMTGNGASSIMKLYVDSNIFLNVWFEEMLRLSPAFYYSRRILDAILECRFSLVVSDLTVQDLSGKTSLTKEVIINEYLKP